MVSLDTGSGGGTPRVFECNACDTTLVTSQEPDEVVCCGEQMTLLDANDDSLLHQPEIDVILGEVFGLSHNAIITCIVVIERGPITADEIADIVDVSVSTVSNALHHLVEAGILEKFERNLKAGGSVNVYQAVPLEEQQTIYRRGLYQWVSESIQRINEFDIQELKAEYRPDEGETKKPSEQMSIYWETGRGPASTD